MLKTKTLLFILSCSLCIIISCKKPDLAQGQLEAIQNSESIQTNGSNDLYRDVTSYLETRKSTAPTYEAERIDTLLENLSDENMVIFALNDSIDIIMADLETYSNQSIPAYDSTFYKAYFTSVNGIIKGGLIFTIHTNSSKAAIDADIENIFNQESTWFTGRTVVNELNDVFTQEMKFTSGILDSIYGITSNLDIESGSDCYAYYLITTTYYPDGTHDSYSEYVGTVCEGGGCGGIGVIGQATYLVFDDCGGGGGGGSGGGNDEAEIYDEESASLNDGNVS